MRQTVRKNDLDAVTVQIRLLEETHTARIHFLEEQHELCKRNLALLTVRMEVNHDELLASREENRQLCMQLAAWHQKG